MSDDKCSVFERVKVEGIAGDWLHFGKNELGSEVYLRIAILREFQQPT